MTDLAHEGKPRHAKSIKGHITDLAHERKQRNKKVLSIKLKVRAWRPTTKNNVAANYKK